MLRYRHNHYQQCCYDDLYRAADIAMYMAKSQGGNKALFYSPDMVDQRATIEGPVRVEAPGRNK